MQKNLKEGVDFYCSCMLLLKAIVVPRLITIVARVHKHCETLELFVDKHSAIEKCFKFTEKHILEKTISYCFYKENKNIQKNSYAFTVLKKDLH